jgi:hypothetical protein
VTSKNTSTGKAPANTFGESVIVDGITFDIGKWWLATTGEDCWMIPFRRAKGLHTFNAMCGAVKPTSADIRKAVIAQIEHLKSIGEDFKLACPTCNGSGFK